MDHELEYLEMLELYADDLAPANTPLLWIADLVSGQTGAVPPETKESNE